MNTKSSPFSAKSRGFTLIEMLVIIAIIIILISIVSVSVGRSIRRAQSVKAMSNARQLGIASLNYAVDHRGNLLGQGQSPHDWNDSVYIFRNLAMYLDSSLPPNPPRAQVENALRDILDPAVPSQYNTYGSYPFTWAFNHIFNVRTGRSNENLESWPSGLPRRPRNLTEFEHPSTTIYVVSGRFQLSPDRAADESRVHSVPSGATIFYFHGRAENSTVALYLDGSTKLVPFPIPPTHIHPRTR